jgi:hypothetical protein
MHCVQNSDISIININVKLVYIIVVYKVKEYSGLTFWLRDAPTSLTFNNCTLCPHCMYVLCKQRLVPLTA